MDRMLKTGWFEELHGHSLDDLGRTKSEFVTSGPSPNAVAAAHLVHKAKHSPKELVPLPALAKVAFNLRVKPPRGSPYLTLLKTQLRNIDRCLLQHHDCRLLRFRNNVRASVSEADVADVLGQRAERRFRGSVARWLSWQQASLRWCRSPCERQSWRRHVQDYLGQFGEWMTPTELTTVDTMLRDSVRLAQN